MKMRTFNDVQGLAPFHGAHIKIIIINSRLVQIKTGLVGLLHVSLPTHGKKPQAIGLRTKEDQPTPTSITQCYTTTEVVYNIVRISGNPSGRILETKTEKREANNNIKGNNKKQEDARQSSWYIF